MCGTLGRGRKIRVTYVEEFGRRVAVGHGLSLCGRHFVKVMEDGRSAERGEVSEELWNAGWEREPVRKENNGSCTDLKVIQ